MEVVDKSNAVKAKVIEVMQGGYVCIFTTGANAGDKFFMERKDGITPIVPGSVLTVSIRRQ